LDGKKQDFGSKDFISESTEPVLLVFLLCCWQCQYYNVRRWDGSAPGL